MQTRSILYTLIGALAVIYPFIVYYGLNHFSPSFFAWALLLLLIVRVVVKGNYKEPSQWAQLIIVGAFCVVAALLNSEHLLRYYPVLMSVGFSALFAYSLTSKTSLIERFAKMAGTDYAPEAIGYMRKLTLIWAVFLACNAIVAAYTACCMPLKAWTLYNGLIAYFLMGLLSVSELVFRYFFKKKNNL